ncbi:hypothetical protein POM88_042270 [Heracleum sosnowskyi]|uniref:Flotillin-like n=1 Tax=Heracleum sosnowskyi TaxID=360622 RepID=A0AAD8MBH2_9APIA|nr:hypothetical protein POM88_042270 [Heracleum sosnowskyi]
MFKVVNNPGPMITDVRPVMYKFNVQAMSSDKLPLIVPGFFTIGPSKDGQGLLKYATFVSARHMRWNHVQELVRDVIKSKIRVAAALKTMDEINRDAKKFTWKVLAEVELELDQFGLQVYNASVKKVKKVPWYNVRHGWRRPLKPMFSKLRLGWRGPLKLMVSKLRLRWRRPLKLMFSKLRLGWKPPLKLIFSKLRLKGKSVKKRIKCGFHVVIKADLRHSPLQLVQSEQELQYLSIEHRQDILHHQKTRTLIPLIFIAS